MKTKLCLIIILILFSHCSFAQNGWTICNTPAFHNRVDDIFMADPQTGYAVCGDGQIVKTTDGGTNWYQVSQDSTYWRSVEFINSQKGFVGGLNQDTSTISILKKTLDGGTTWTDLTAQLNPRAKKGICGLAVADSNTIYGCGNWFEDSAYIVKSSDGGNSWSFIDMTSYAASLIDMYFLNKDTGFATGRGTLPFQTAVILYTTDGGLTWTYKFQDTYTYEYCWKIQHLTDQIYFASIQAFSLSPARILKSVDGGMTWSALIVDSIGQDLQGVGFIDSLLGWTGGGASSNFETTDGGITWTLNHICPRLNRVFKVNDTLLFASGFQIWKYNRMTNGILPIVSGALAYSTITCYPNPADDDLAIDVSLKKSTHVLLNLFDNTGKVAAVIENRDKIRGAFTYYLNTKKLNPGTYHLVLRTHEDKADTKVIVIH